MSGDRTTVSLRNDSGDIRRADIDAFSYVSGTGVIPQNVLAPVTSGVAYSQPLSAVGSNAPYVFRVTGGMLSADLRLSESGVLSGAPSSTTLTTLTITASDTLGRSGMRTYTLGTPPVQTPPVASTVAVTAGAKTSVTARVTSAGAKSAVSGSVTLLENGRKVGSATVGASGVANIALAAHPLTGTYALTATYSGNAAFKGRTSPVVALKVTKAKAKVTVKAAKKQVKRHTKVKLAVKIKVPAGVSAKGKVVVYDKGRKVATVKVPASGAATLKVRISKKIGKHTITVRYTGSANVVSARATAKGVAKR